MTCDMYSLLQQGYSGRHDLLAGKGGRGGLSGPLGTVLSAVNQAVHYG